MTHVSIVLNIAADVAGEFERAFAGHHAHDEHPGFRRWNEMADAYQPEEPYVFGGNSLYEVGD